MTEERRQEIFLAKIAKGWRICIYEPIRESLGLEVGDRLRVTIWKDPPSKLVKPVVETEPEKPVEAIPDFRAPEEEKKTPPPTPTGKQEYVDPCLYGLDFPLQDLEICIDCESYEAKKCTWPEWKKIGWEEEAE